MLCRLANTISMIKDWLIIGHWNSIEYSIRNVYNYLGPVDIGKSLQQKLIISDNNKASMASMGYCFQYLAFS